MATYNDDERYRGRGNYARDDDYERSREERYRGAYGRDRGWEVGREDPSRYGTGWSGNYERGYGSQYFTGDDQGRGFAGGRDMGRSYLPSNNRGWSETQESERGYSRPYGASGPGPQYAPDFDRRYEGTYRPPYYGRDYERQRDRTYRGEGLAGDRGWFDRASDEVASWFGDDDAERRRRIDKVREANHRGRGPKGYRRSDERIKEDVNDRLTDHPYLDASDIVVSVKQCEITLSGTVNDRTDKRVAEDIAESVSGVTNVQNNLRVKEENVSTAGLATARTASTTR
jgi:osmotically-inducible protein OsmY